MSANCCATSPRQDLLVAWLHVCQDVNTLGRILQQGMKALIGRAAGDGGGISGWRQLQRTAKVPAPWATTQTPLFTQACKISRESLASLSETRNAT
jgi:hypothetical protein